MTARGCGCWRHGPALVWLRLWARGVALPCGSSVVVGCMAAARDGGSVMQSRYARAGVALHGGCSPFPFVVQPGGAARPSANPHNNIYMYRCGQFRIEGRPCPCPVVADGCLGGRCPAFCRYCRASGSQAWHKNSAPVAAWAPAHCWFSGLAGGGPLPPPSAFIQAARHRACRWPRWRG